MVDYFEKVLFKIMRQVETSNEKGVECSGQKKSLYKGPHYKELNRETMWLRLNKGNRNQTKKIIWQM